nr:hypothetical protein [Tanacetum cinerariifolium]
MTGNLKLLSKFVEQFLGTVKFGNDQIAPILGYGDLVQGNVTIKRVYYVKGLNHNLFSVGQLCDADLEVAFQKSTCYIRDLKENDILTAWLWHRCLSHLNFEAINLLLKYEIVTGLPKLKFVKDHLCSSCELGKEKRKSFKKKTTPSPKRRLQILHIALCGPMRVERFCGKKYVLVIVDDYSRYTWTHFLRSKDETPEVLIDFLKLVQRGLHAQVRTVQTDKGINFLNKTLHAYFNQEGGTFMKGRPKECYDLIENMNAHHNDWDTSVQRSASSTSIPSSSDLEIVALKAKMVKINKNRMNVLQINQQVKAVTHNSKTCGGPHSYNDCPATIGQTQKQEEKRIMRIDEISKFRDATLKRVLEKVKKINLDVKHGYADSALDQALESSCSCWSVSVN